MVEQDEQDAFPNYSHPVHPVILSKLHLGLARRPARFKPMGESPEPVRRGQAAR
jgi:hypothetical protein